jgi:Tol biopolymer transport system component
MIQIVGTWRGARLIVVIAALVTFAGSVVGAGAASEQHATRVVFSAAFVYNDMHAPDRQIYSVSSSGGALAQLTFGAQPASNPLPSPDGRHIVFSRGASLWVMGPDGRGQRLLAARGAEAAWTPDSHAIAYVALAMEDRPTGIRSISANGASGRLLVRGSVSSPAWSPDGRELAYGRGSTLVVARVGRGRPVLRRREAGTVGRIAWSPEGRWLAFETGVHIAFERLDGGSGGTAGPGRQPAWSPTGRLLAYLPSDDSALQSDVAVFDVRTASRRELPTPGRTGSRSYAALDSFAWSPKGEAIAYAKTESDQSRIGIVTLAGVARALTDSYPQAERVRWSLSPPGYQYRSPEGPGPVISADELRSLVPVQELAADGDRVAYRLCGRTIGVWEQSTRDVVRAAGEMPLCRLDPKSYYDVALAGDRVAWGARNSGNFPSTEVWVRSFSSPNSRIVGSGGGENAAERRDHTGFLLGSGEELVFASRAYCDDATANSCSGLPLEQRRVVEQTVWRIREPTWQGQCPAGLRGLYPGPCQKLATEPGPLVPNDLESGRIVALGDNALVLLDENGARLLSLDVRAVGAQLSGSDLVVLLQGQLRQYDAGTGALVHAWPLPDVPSAGPCGESTCSDGPLRFEDAAHGLVVYIFEGKVELLRLRDGERAVVADGTAARFGSNGLFYAYEGAAPWRGRIRFVPFAELPIS